MRNETFLFKGCLLVISCVLVASPIFAKKVTSTNGDCMVRALGPEDWEETTGGDRGDAYQNKVLDLGEYQERAVRAALDRMPPLLCHSLEKIVFVNADIQIKDEAKRGTLGIVYTDQPATVYISASGHVDTASENHLNRSVPANQGTFARVIRRILHEAVHTAGNLLESQTEGYDGEQAWASGAQGFASEVVENMRLKTGFDDEWERLHESFVESSCNSLGKSHWVCTLGPGGMNLAGDYDRVLAKEIGQEADEKAHLLGFSTAYGARNSSEDLAEVVSAALVADLYSEEGVDVDGYVIKARPLFDACWRLNKEAGPGIPAAVAALYTKLAFARDAKFVSQAEFEDCVGEIRHQHSGQGYFSYKDNKPSKEYKINVDAGIGTSANALDMYRSFRFRAEGPTNLGSTPVTGRIMLKLDVALRLESMDTASWPRGAYLIETESGFFGNQFWFVVDEDRAGTFFATRAVVLVTGSSHEIVEGTVFVVSGWRPFAPIPVPQLGLPAKATFRAIKPGMSNGPMVDDPAAGN